jgi:DNA-binding XRE family transcriptional regulator
MDIIRIRVGQKVRFEVNGEVGATGVVTDLKWDGSSGRWWCEVQEPGGRKDEYPVAHMHPYTETVLRRDQWPELAQRLRALRKEKGRSLVAVGQDAKLAPQQVQQYETGEHTPQLKSLRRILFVLGTTLESFLEDAHDRP